MAGETEVLVPEGEPPRFLGVKPNPALGSRPVVESPTISRAPPQEEMKGPLPSDVPDAFVP